MKKLYFRLATLIAYLVFIFNITRINIRGGRVIHIHPFFYIFTSIYILSIITIPFLRNANTVNLSIGSVFLYALSNLYFFRDALFEGEYIYTTLAEVLLLISAIFLTSQVLIYIKNLQNALETLLFPKNDRIIYEEHQAESIIEREFSRSRRGHHSITTMVIELDPSTDNLPEQPAMDDLLNDLKKRFLIAKLTKLISSQARMSDMIINIKDKKQLLVISPETTSEQSRALAKRITTVAENSLGIKLLFGTASFPQDGHTYLSTREIAESNLSELSN